MQSASDPYAGHLRDGAVAQCLHPCQVFVGASKPPFLHDKSLEGTIKAGLKRFPACEFPQGQASYPSRFMPASRTEHRALLVARTATDTPRYFTVSSCDRDVESH